MSRLLHDKKGNKKEKKKRNKKKIIVILAVLNLIFLFVFDYKIPGLSGTLIKIKEKKNTQQMENNSEAERVLGNITIDFEQNTLNYNGEGELDLL